MRKSISSLFPTGLKEMAKISAKAKREAELRADELKSWMHDNIEGEVVGDPAMVKRTNNWLKDIWGVKEVQALGLMARGVLCSCLDCGKRNKEISEFYEIAEPTRDEANVVNSFMSRR